MIIFDEIQYLKGWDIELKTLVDRFRQTKFIASGSAAGTLNRKSTESGAGRFTDFLLPPLTFYEYLDLLGKGEQLLIESKKGDVPEPKNISQLNREFINYLNYGGFPEAVLNKEIQKDPGRFIRGDIIDKVLLKDLPSLYGVQDTQELNRFFSSLVYQTGNEVSYANLSKSSGVAKNTIKKYLKYLEAAFLIRTVRRVDNTGKRFKRDNFFKVYLTNPSIYAAIYEPVSEDDPALLGHLVETSIFSQYMQDSTRMNQIYYARWKGGKGEVDLVSLNKHYKVDSCMEIKWSDRGPNKIQSFGNLINFCFKNNLKKAVVLTKSKRKFIEYKGIKFAFLESCVTCFFIGKALITEKGIQGFLDFTKENFPDLIKND
ncbi:MAG: ATP-binding protein [Nitrospinae bacterium]|nr:ATP-binding protein [Nitrospinota bacterium]